MFLKEFINKNLPHDFKDFFTCNKHFQTHDMVYTCTCCLLHMNGTKFPGFNPKSQMQISQHL